MGIRVEIKDHGFLRILSEVSKFKGAVINAGVLSSAPAYDEGGKANLADVATWMEYGAPSVNIPPRPFMTQTFNKYGAEARLMFRQQLDLIYQGKATADLSIKKIGVWYKGRIQDTITHGSFAPNAESTLISNWRKHLKGRITRTEALENDRGGFGSNKKPLIDSGHLRKSIEFEVVKK